MIYLICLHLITLTLIVGLSYWHIGMGKRKPLKHYRGKYFLYNNSNIQMVSMSSFHFKVIWSLKGFIQPQFSEYFYQKQNKL